MLEEKKEGREVDIKEERKGERGHRRTQCRAAWISYNIWSEKGEHNAHHRNTSNTRVKLHDKCEGNQDKNMMKWENKKF